MTEKIKITETNLLDMASVVNYEIIQVDRLIIQMKNELLSENKALPKDEATNLS